MNIGILSMHRVINNGSLLQAYALKKVIEGLGHNVQFVDFNINNKNNFANYKVKLKKNHKYLAIFLMTIKKLIKMDIGNWNIAKNNIIMESNFLKDYMSVLRLTDYPNYNAKVDVLVFGSDEVFNTVQYVELQGSYVWELYGENNNAQKLISYAASFGHTTYRQLEKYNMVEKSGELLSKFDNLSVRDQNSRDIIQKLTGRTPMVNIDPVLLYDFSDIDIKKPEIENYILVYAYAGRINKKDEIDAIKRFARKHNKKIICVNMYQTWADETIHAHPFGLLGYFKYADYVVTDTFHGAVISIKYNVPFIQFTRETSTYSNNQKVGYLLRSFGLEDRILKDLNDFEKILLKNIDYECVNAKINLEQNKSFNYLKEALK